MKLLFGPRLKEERDRLGLNQDDFAALGEVAPRAYWNYEKGRVSPDADFLARLCDKGVDVMYVLTGRRSFVLGEPAAAGYSVAHQAAGEIAALPLDDEDASALLAVARRLGKKT